MGRLAKYRPDQVAITVAGVPITGYADDEFVLIENMSDMFDEVVGTDGEVARSPTGDMRVKITVKLLQTSLANAVLSQLLTDDLAAINGQTFTAQVEDTLGGTLAQGADCWIRGWPKSSFKRKADMREWEIMIATGERFEEGN